MEDPFEDHVECCKSETKTGSGHFGNRFKAYATLIRGISYPSLVFATD